MKIVPIGDKVVLERMEAEEHTAGGIVLPDSARDRSSHGRIMSIGDGVPLPDGTRTPFQVREGDRVLFAEFAGSKVLVDGQELLVLRESDILAIVS